MTIAKGHGRGAQALLLLLAAVFMIAACPSAAGRPLAPGEWHLQLHEHLASRQSLVSSQRMPYLAATEPLQDRSRETTDLWGPSLHA